MLDLVVDKHGVPISEGAEVCTGWPGAVSGRVLAVTDWDGDYADGRVVGWPPKVIVVWDRELTNDAGQKWRNETCDTTQDMREAYAGNALDRCEDLEVIA